MYTLSTHTSRYHVALGKLLTALALASLFGGLSVRPVLADGHNSQSEHDQRYNKHDKNHDRRDWRHERYEGKYYRPRAYQQPYYRPYVVSAPPAVVYAPPQSPGISIFFPIDIH